MPIWDRPGLGSLLILNYDGKSSPTDICSQKSDTLCPVGLVQKRVLSLSLLAASAMLCGICSHEPEGNRCGSSVSYFPKLRTVTCLDTMSVCDFTPEEFVQSTAFRYISDAITKEEALTLLKSRETTKQERTENVLQQGYPAYTTSVGCESRRYAITGLSNSFNFGSKS